MRNLNWYRVRTVAKHDLKQLMRSKDFLIPMGILGGLFFVVLPAALLFSIEAIGQVGSIQQISNALEVLPERAQEQLQGDTPTARTQYALAVYLFAPWPSSCR